MLVMLDGEPGSAIEVRVGEAVLLPRNDPQVLATAPSLRPVNADDLIQPPQGGGLARIVHGGGGVPAHIACGFLGSDRHSNPLIDTLPRLLVVDMGRSGDWIESSLRFALQRLADGEAGSSTVMARLSELMFVEAVRSYAATLPPVALPVVPRQAPVSAVRTGRRRPSRGPCRP